MAATVTAKSGHHIAYYRQQAAPRVERSPLSYYSAGARQGEAPGRWFGRALPALGLAEGQVVDMEDDGPYVQVYGQVNPLTGERLAGRRGRRTECEPRFWWGWRRRSRMRPGSGTGSWRGRPRTRRIVRRRTPT